jgi:hypothetical protein
MQESSLPATLPATMLLLQAMPNATMQSKLADKLCCQDV